MAITYLDNNDKSELASYISSIAFKAEEIEITENIVTLGTGWSGNNVDGYTHTDGNTEPLSFAINAVDGESYIIEYDCSLSGDSILLKLGSAENLESVYPTSPYNGTKKNQWGLVSTGDNGILQVIPVSSYTGYIKNLKCYKITENGTKEITVALNNVGIGNLPKHIAGFYNFYLSPTSMQKSVNGTRNVAIGYASLRDIISGGRNIGLGTFSLSNLIYGENNIGIGADAMIYPTLAENIIAIGKGAMGNGKQRTDDIAIGRYALAGNPTKETVTQKNVAIGLEAGRDCESSGNVFIGSAAGAKTSKSANNVYIGKNAGSNITTGWGNTIIGADAKSTGNFSQVTVVGQGAQATKHKQAVFGPDATEETILKGNVLVRGVDGVFREIAYIENIPTKTSELENNSGYVTSNDLRNLPEVTEADNGKILMVVNGKWQAVNVEGLTAITKNEEEIPLSETY